MRIFPAIDLISGKAVRLFRGDYDKMTVYSDNPSGVARSFRQAGARYIHIVDLEGAKDGTPKNLEAIRDIIAASSLKAEVGGGIRSGETIEKYVAAGAARVILGTAALENKELLRMLVKEYKELIAVGVDVRDGFVAIKGWKETSTVQCFDFMSELESIGVKTVICTDISKDGAMVGTNREMYKELCRRYKMDITASGGVSSLEDIRALKETGLYGAIIGKALYTKDIDLHAAIEIAGEQE